MAFEHLHRPFESSLFRGATKWLIVISTIVFVLQLFFGRWFVPYLALTPAAVMSNGWVWQPITYLFLHGGVFHFLLNMLVLWMFGREIENRWGTARFLRFFFLTGVGAGLIALIFMSHSEAAIIGSSGAVFGLLVAFAILFPEAVMYLYFLIPMKAWHACVLFGVIELATIWNHSPRASSAWVHLSGMAIGFLYLQISRRVSMPAFVHVFQARLKRLRKPKKKSIEFFELTDELVSEVDQILEKVLKKGVESLTPREKAIMDRYTQLKRR